MRVLSTSSARGIFVVSRFALRGQHAILASCERGLSVSVSLKLAQTHGVEDKPPVSRTRNVGIIAHIDAGKTTTTERMLFYGGYTRRIGDVDDGSTVTDFLPAERARGITIQSAAITFKWPPKSSNSESPETINQIHAGLVHKSTVSHSINLIDTPGHADFTFEVRRSLRVLDGAVCILDGVAGVEAQTEQVWKQAAEWRIPKIVFVNKLDRDGAAFGRTVGEIGARLGGWPAVCQIPWWEGGKGRFTGVADVISLHGLLYEYGGDGKSVKKYTYDELMKSNSNLAEELKRARVALIELLSEHDDSMVEAFLDANGDHMAVSSIQIMASLRRCLLKNDDRVIPVFAGASFRNIGVQPLLDAVVNLLPDPSERPDAEVSIGNVRGTLQQFLRGDLALQTRRTGPAKGAKKGIALSSSPIAQAMEGCALAFKVVNDPRKGVLVYFRVYAGSINRNSVLFNTNLNVSERATNLMQMYASDSVPVSSIEAGQIGVIAGSKFARTGDTLIAYKGQKASPPEPISLLQLRPIKVPPPVFFASIEPNSLRDEREMHEKLTLLLREDPSLHVSQDPDTGQTLLSGMGELHLEIARDRLVNDFKARATMGKIEIGYRETPLKTSASMTKIFDKNRPDGKGKAGCTALVMPFDAAETNEPPTQDGDENTVVHLQDGNCIIIRAPTLDDEGRSLSSDDETLPPHLSIADIQVAYLNGALAALSRGPTHSYPMSNTCVNLTLDPATHIFGSDSNLSALSSAARLATTAALKDAVAEGGSALMEPVMNVDISVDEGSLGNVVQDLSSSRGGHVFSLDAEVNDETVVEDGVYIDVRKIYAPPDPFGSSSSSPRSSDGQAENRSRTIKAKVPLKEMIGYLKHLRSLSGGRGTFVMSVDRFEKMSSQREKMVVAELHGG